MVLVGFKPDLWRPTGFLQCFDTVGLVIWPVKIVPEMTYLASSGTLNRTRSLGIPSGVQGRSPIRGYGDEAEAVCRLQILTAETIKFENFALFTFWFLTSMFHAGDKRHFGGKRARHRLGADAWHRYYSCLHQKCCLLCNQQVDKQPIYTVDQTTCQVKIL